MELKEVKYFCKEFYIGFSTLNLYPYQLRYVDSPDNCSIDLITFNERVDIEGLISVDENSVRLLKINCFDDIDTFFIFNTPQELYDILLSMLLACCHASGVKISISEVINTTLGHLNQLP